MAKKLLNPRGYLSWTQVDLWMKSQDAYKRRYFYGEDAPENAAMAFGKRTAEALETGAASGDDLIDAVATLLTRYQRSEHEIRATLKTPAGDVVLLGVLDTFDPKAPRFREYKTGRVKWTQSRARRHKQLLHYASLVYLFHGKLPTEVWLDWAETEMGELEDGSIGVRFTGNLQSFKVEVGLKDVLEYLALAGRVAREVDEAYRAEISKLS